MFGWSWWAPTWGPARGWAWCSRSPGSAPPGWSAASTPAGCCSSGHSPQGRSRTGRSHLRKQKGLFCKYLPQTILTLFIWGGGSLRHLHKWQKPDRRRTSSSRRPPSSLGPPCRLWAAGTAPTRAHRFRTPFFGNRNRKLHEEEIFYDTNWKWNRRAWGVKINQQVWDFNLCFQSLLPGFELCDGSAQLRLFGAIFLQLMHEVTLRGKTRPLPQRAAGRVTMSTLVSYFSFFFVFLNI